MADDDDKRKDPEPKTGVLIQAPQPLPLVTPTGQQKTLRRILSKLSTWPFGNRRYVETLKSATEVFEARTELGEAVVKHDEIRDRLKHFGTVLARNQEQRNRELFEEKERRRTAENTFKLEETMQDEKNRLKMEDIKRQQREQQIERMEQEKRELLLAKELEELRKPPPSPEPPKKPSSRAQSPKQKERTAAHKRYESEMERIDKMKGAAKTKMELVKTAANDLEKELAQIDPEP